MHSSLFVLRLWQYLVLCWVLFASSSAYCAYLLTQDTQRVPFYGHVEVLEDPTGLLTFEQARTAAFTPSSTYPSLNLGYKTGAVWLKLAVRADQHPAKLWRVVFDYASLDEVRFYDSSKDATYLAQAGDRVDQALHSRPYRTVLFEFSLAPNETRTLYMRISSYGTLTLSGNVMSLNAFEQHSQRGYIAHSLYFGIFLALGLYNLVLFIALGERPFLNYVLFLTAFATGIAALNGYGAQFIWTSGDAWTNRILPLSMTLCECLAIVFTRSFLETQRRLPRLDVWLRALRNLTLIAIATSLFLPDQYATKVMSVTGISFTLALLVTGFICMVKRVPGATLFTLAWLVLIAGSGLMALRNFTLIASNFFTMYAMQIGSALEMVLLSLALASRFNAIKHEREAVLRESERLLEQRVCERTLALEQANQRLSDLALRDPLTGLANRNALRAHLEELFKHPDCRTALMLIDLDGFKPINDRYGHETGDLVLVEVAKRLCQTVSTEHLAARLGGDEFVVVCDPDQAHAIGFGLLHTLYAPIQAGAYQVQVGASIGLAFSEPNDSKQSLLKRADNAMYVAKAQGRNRLFEAPSTASVALS